MSPERKFAPVGIQSGRGELCTGANCVPAGWCAGPGLVCRRRADCVVQAGRGCRSGRAQRWLVHTLDVPQFGLVRREDMYVAGFVCRRDVFCPDLRAVRAGAPLGCVVGAFLLRRVGPGYEKSRPFPVRLFGLAVGELPPPLGRRFRARSRGAGSSSSGSQPCSCARCCALPVCRA